MYFGMYRRSVLGNSKLDLKSLLKGSILQIYEAIRLHSFGKTLKRVLVALNVFYLYY